MAFHTIQVGGLEYLTADSLAGSRHCFSTRFGGVSQGALASLNLGTHRGDDPANVRRNYEILGAAVGFSAERTVFTKQIHTDVVRRVTEADCGAGLLRETGWECDALITDTPGVALCCFSADCVPILLYDPVRRAAAAVHSGWRGTALGIAAKTVRAMESEFGCDPTALHAAIGPCISACCFETDRDVPDAMRAALGTAAEAAITQTGEKFHVDLKAINRLWLTEAGLLPEHIDISDACTACDPTRFWSHRRVGTERGSLAGIIAIAKEETPCDIDA
jgi:hypothetical protein